MTHPEVAALYNAPFIPFIDPGALSHSFVGWRLAF